MQKASTMLVSTLVFFLSITTAQAWTLQSPLAGYLTDRPEYLAFGDSWQWGECGGRVKKHAGTDVQSWAGEPVYAAHEGIVRAAKIHSKKWGGFVTIDHSPGKTYWLTTVSWHVTPTVSRGQGVSKGQLIGRVSNLGNNTHFHFGVRKEYYSNTSNAGALPPTKCGGYPAFSGKFIDPQSLNYEYRSH